MQTISERSVLLSGLSINSNKRINIVLVCLLTLISSFSCSSSRLSKKTKNIIDKTLGSDYTAIPNKSKTFLLCYKDYGDDPKKIGEFEYLIINLKTRQVLRSEKLRYGEIKWIDDQNVEIKEGRGIIENLKEGKKTSIYNVIKDTIINGNAKKK